MKPWLPLILVTTACNNFLTVPPPPPPPPGTPTLSTISTSFSNPLYLTAAPADTHRVFVVEQTGRIKIIVNDTVILPTPFLDLHTKISSGGERGLLSMAFHPQYASNGQFYVYFTDPSGDLRIVRYTVAASNPDSADEASADTVLKIPHPFYNNHNGGQLQFGPDGKFYIGTGDGGGGGDSAGNAQNKHALLGKLLRIDVSGASGYTIPSDNPFATDTSAASEVWSYGLRNPWRFSFDKSTGDLYIADVGQDSWEEVDVSAAGGAGGAGGGSQAGRGVNFGWNVREGKHCYKPVTGCATAGLADPIFEYPHAINACSITGGYVYRGAGLPVMLGFYFYADYCNGIVGSLQYSGGNVTQLLDWTTLLSPGGGISSFGLNAVGEMYILTIGGGVYKIVPHP
jgi:glucose/arabinose dehydrogenase